MSTTRCPQCGNRKRPDSQICFRCVPRRTPSERFWGHVKKTDLCWLWKGGLMRDGYGTFKYDTRGNGRHMAAHRFAYEDTIGPIPEGLQLDHLCRNKRCVNPDHLEAVTQRENVLRGFGPTARHARKTHCVNGHPLSGANLRLTGKGYRKCRACESEENRRKRKKRLNETNPRTDADAIDRRGVDSGRSAKNTSERVT